jgi:hypothetical protein
MFFDCKITLAIKEPGSQLCPVPQCPDPPRRRHRHRRLKRRHLEGNQTAAATDEGTEESEEQFNGPQGMAADDEALDDCVSQIGLITMAPLNAAMLVGAIVLIRDGFKQFRRTEQ